MTFTTFPLIQTLRHFAAAACVIAAASCAPAGQAGQNHPADSAGALVYHGATFSQRSPAGEPLYRYERRVVSAPAGLSAGLSAGLMASHITSDPAGRVVIVESATLSSQYEVRRFEATNHQLGFAGSVQISSDGRRLQYELSENGKASKASEEVSDPVVTGPSLFGFILKNWEVLITGASLPVRMLVLKEKTTYGFDIKHEKQGNGQASFTITPSSFLVRMAIAPMRVVFDANTKTPLRYEGRVPPMENVAGKLKDLDARVEYTAVAATYR